LTTGKITPFFPDSSIKKKNIYDRPFFDFRPEMTEFEIQRHLLIFLSAGLNFVINVFLCRALMLCQ